MIKEKDKEKEFFEGLIELQYGFPVESKLKELAQKIPWAREWPKNKVSFWNAEAFMWARKVDRKLRNLISQELNFLNKLNKGNNLDLGCGAYSYLPSRVGMDLSPEMLKQNDFCVHKIAGDVEKRLPFKAEEFNSITAVFLFNYVQNYFDLLLEIKRVLSEKGILMIILYSGELNDWQKRQEANHFSASFWKKMLVNAGFKVHFYEKEKLWFFKCSKS